jgi:hypothetical protein
VKEKKKIHAKDFDKMVDSGEDLGDVLIPVNVKSVVIDLPLWMIDALDEEACRLNVPRKALINIWLADRLQTNKQTIEKKKA